jgi:CheY-like chemotaxis protein
MPLALPTSLTILVVDDEPTLISALTHLLGRDGATVETAADGQEALTRLQTRAYDVILCDLRMPALDGATFYAHLTQQYPALRQRVIFLTGATVEADSMAFLAACGQPWLTKPCTITAVRSALRQVLRDSPTQAIPPQQREARRRKITSTTDLEFPRLQFAIRQGEVKDLPTDPEAAALILASTYIREVPEPERTPTRQDS